MAHIALHTPPFCDLFADSIQIRAGFATVCVIEFKEVRQLCEFTSFERKHIVVRDGWAYAFKAKLGGIHMKWTEAIQTHRRATRWRHQVREKWYQLRLAVVFRWRFAGKSRQDIPNDCDV